MINRFRSALGNMLLKAASLSFTPAWLKTAWTDLAFHTLVREGYKGNSAVWACVRVYARAFPEPEMHVFPDTQDGKEKPPDHPVRQLIAPPNPYMGEDELWAFAIQRGPALHVRLAQERCRAVHDPHDQASTRPEGPQADAGAVAQVIRAR